MKKAVFTLSLMLVAMLGFNGFAQGNGQPIGGQADGPVLTIDKELHDYGTIDYAGNGECVFTITNTGNAPLIIENCKGSCGCTVPTWSRDPIAPGASTKITVRYDTKRPGPFNKQVTITSNAVNAPSNSKIIKIKGTVKPKPVTESEVTPPTN
jgi:hypothetical protein